MDFLTIPGTFHHTTRCKRTYMKPKGAGMKRKKKGKKENKGQKTKKKTQPRRVPYAIRSWRCFSRRAASAASSRAFSRAAMAARLSRRALASAATTMIRFCTQPVVMTRTELADTTQPRDSWQGRRTLAARRASMAAFRTASASALIFSASSRSSSSRRRRASSCGGCRAQHDR